LFSADFDLLTIIDPVDLAVRAASGSAAHRQEAITIWIEANNLALSLTGIKVAVSTKDDWHIDCFMCLRTYELSAPNVCRRSRHFP
jgi:hypothetical protein